MPISLSKKYNPLFVLLYPKAEPAFASLVCRKLPEIFRKKVVNRISVNSQVYIIPSWHLWKFWCREPKKKGSLVHESSRFVWGPGKGRTTEFQLIPKYILYHHDICEKFDAENQTSENNNYKCYYTRKVSSCCKYKNNLINNHTVNIRLCGVSKCVYFAG
jgi:hypothetical protein